MGRLGSDAEVCGEGDGCLPESAPPWSEVGQALAEAAALAGADAERVASLLRDAIGGLLRAFDTLAVTAGQQRAWATSLPDEAVRQRAEALAAGVDQGVRLAIQGLQFEDMCAQLLGALSHRLSDLEAAARLLEGCGEAADEQRAVGLVCLREALMRVRQPGHGAPVRQGSMNAGEIELF